jgi:transposase-like protein
MPMSKSQKRKPSSAGASPTEVVPAKKRRVFSAAEKLRIIQEAAACGPGEQAALLRREGIYSSHLATWRRQLATHGTAGVSAIKRGRKPKFDDKDRKIALLEKQLRVAEKELEIRQALIEFQKKVSELLGINLADPEAR